jgi:hypothetical protein
MAFGPSASAMFCRILPTVSRERATRSGTPITRFGESHIGRLNGDTNSSSNGHPTDAASPAHGDRAQCLHHGEFGEFGVWRRTACLSSNRPSPSTRHRCAVSVAVPQRLPTAVWSWGYIWGYMSSLNGKYTYSLRDIVDNCDGLPLRQIRRISNVFEIFFAATHK